VKVEGKYQEVEEAKKLLEQNATELSVSSKYKSEFIANMSHELRTPLNSLLVLAEQLEDNPDGNLSERQVQYASVIHSSGRDLLKLLNDILELAKVESQTVHLEVSELRLSDLCTNLEQTFDPVAEAEGLAFSVELDRNLPATLSTDPHRLRQVLQNLLSNAFKFTSQGSVGVQLSLSPNGWSPHHERLARAESVIAISIEKDLQPAMFEAFAQADGTTARHYGGTGLGLSISRNLVGLLGGELTVTSEPGTGSTFTVYLPLQAGVLKSPAPVAPSPFLMDGGGLEAAENTQPSLDASQRTAETPAGEEFYSGAAAGTTVLIVDDYFPNIFALSALLERGKLNVVVAQSGFEALAALEERSDIDIVLMDIMMPVMDGYDTMIAIRKRPDSAELPIIAVTGKVTGSERERCIAAGATDYIPKPVDPAELLAVLAQWLPATSQAHLRRS
jgi:CheY-like chemotaxis protein